MKSNKVIVFMALTAFGLYAKVEAKKRTPKKIEQEAPQRSFLTTALLNITRPQGSVTIVNKTGKKLDHVKVIFKFMGDNNITQHHYNTKGYAYGHITIRNLKKDGSITVFARDAVQHDVTGKVVEHFTDLKDTQVVYVRTGILSHRVFKDGTHAPRFVITKPKMISLYHIQTEEEFDHKNK